MEEEQQPRKRLVRRTDGQPPKRKAQEITIDVDADPENANWLKRQKPLPEQPKPDTKMENTRTSNEPAHGVK
jgi:hypothetical protein